MRINKPTLHKKLVTRLVIGFGGVLMIVLIIVASVWYLRAGYVAATVRYADNTKKVLTEQAVVFKSLKDKPDSVKAQKYLAQLHMALATQAKSAPAVPNMLGMRVVGEPEQQIQDTRVVYTEKAAAAAMQAANLLKYEQALGGSFARVTGKTGKTMDEQKALATAWLALVNDIKALSPPSVAKDIHKKLLNDAMAVQDQVAALPDLTEKDDYAGFIAKQKEVNAKIDTLRGAATAISELHISQDKTLGKALIVLQSNLR